ncbi:MAG: sigma-70 family RNA polymerase sigma factor [Anaerolineales bacterium]|nr:sigma-70 family RNA polymerase sigma factor [Anaerolineales bacterium]
MVAKGDQLAEEKSDQALIRAIKQDDAEACEIVWEWVYTLANSRKYQESDRTRDAAKDAAVAAYRRIVTRGVYKFAYKSPFKWYCAKIFVNEANRALKRKGLQIVDVDITEGVTVIDENQDVEDQATAVSQQIQKRLEPCLQALPLREREIIELLYLEDKSPAVAAEIFKISRNNINVIAHRARKKLQHCLQLAGFATAAEVSSL